MSLRGTIGSLNVRLGLDSADFRRGLSNMERRMGQGMRRMRQAAAGLAAVSAALGAVAIRSGAAIDAQAKLAQSLGTTVGSVQVLQRAGQLAGVSMGEMEAGAARLTRRLSMFVQNGGGPAAKGIEQLGLSAEDLMALPLDERIAEVTRAIEENADASERAALYSQFFGDRAFAAFSRLDSATLEQAADEIDRLGLRISEVDADRIELANDQISGLGQVAKAAGNQIAVAILPALGRMAEALTRAFEKGTALRGVFDFITDKLAGRTMAYAVALGAVSSALIAVRFAILGISIALRGLKAALVSTGVGVFVVLAGELIYRLSGIADGAGDATTALDALDAATQAAVTEARSLSSQMADGKTMTLAQARAVLELADARRVELEASAAQARARARETDEYQKLMEMERALELMRLNNDPRQNDPVVIAQIEAVRAAYESILEPARAIESDLAALEDSVARTTAAIAVSVDGMVTIGDNVGNVGQLAVALSDLRDATERVSDVSVPAAANAVELMRQYGDLSSAAIAAARAQHELATAETMERALATTASLRSSFLGLAENVEGLDARFNDFSAALADAQHADTPGEMARGFGEALRVIETATGGVAQMDEQTGLLYAETARLTQQLLDAAEAAYGGADAAGSFGNAIAAATAAANGLWQNLEGARATLASLGQGLAGLGRSLPILNALIPAGATAADGIGGALGGVVGRLRGRMAGLADIGRDIVANMQEIARSGVPALKRTGGAARQAAESLKATEVAAKDLADTFKSGLTSAIEGVGQAFGDLFTGSIDSFKDFAQRIWGGFRKLLSDMIATAVANPIKISMGVLTGTGAYAGTGGIPVGGGMLSGLMGGVSSLFQDVGKGLTSVVGGLFSGGFGGAASAIGKAFGGIGSGIAGIGTAIGAALPVVGLAAAAFSLFRSKTSELDRGLQVTIGKTGTLTETFRDLEKSRFFGLSKRRSTEMHRASDALSAPIQQAVDAMRGATISAADAIGVSAHRIGGYSKKLRLSTKGMSDEEAQKAILDQLGGVSDELAKLVIGDRSIRAGETASQALSAMQAAMQTINTAFEGLGLKAIAGGISSANAARAMIDAAGGVQNFAQAADLYFQNFYSVGEQAQEMSRRFRAGMDGLGVGVIPATVAQFRGIVDRLNAEGRNAAAAGMIGLAPLFQRMKELQTRAASAADGIAGVGAALSGERDGLLRRLYRLTDNTVALRALELKHLLPTNHALQRRIWALQEERKIDAQVQAAERATVDLLRKPLNLDSSRFSNRYEATMQAARDRDAEIAKEAAKAQLTQLTMIRRAVKEIRDEQRDANLRRTDA